MSRLVKEPDRHRRFRLQQSARIVPSAIQQSSETVAEVLAAEGVNKRVYGRIEITEPEEDGEDSPGRTAGTERP